MRRSAQIQTETAPVEQNVSLSPRTLLTGAQQITRVEHDYRTVTRALDQAMSNVVEAQTAYGEALTNLSQAERVVGRLQSMYQTLYETYQTAQSNPQLAEAMMQQASMSPVASNSNREVTASWASWGKALGILSALGLASWAGWNAGKPKQQPQPVHTGGNVTPPRTVQPAAGSDAEPATSANSTAAPAAGTPGTAESSSSNGAAAMQQLAVGLRMLHNQLSTAMQAYGKHQQYAAGKEREYKAALGSYAQARDSLFQLRDRSAALKEGLSGWTERLSEYYMPQQGTEQ
ncbi:MAG: hypothetical protein JSS66_07025 [Armatimonadetes bacterium]|nr:hypothetical protein [Armatimonadota bacterium]